MVLMLAFVMILPSCYSHKDNEYLQHVSHNDTYVIDLLESTRILRQLIQTNKIGDFLEGHTMEQLEALLNNMSPVQMAAQVEMVRTPVPVVAYFYEPGMRHNLLLPELKDLAKSYDQRVKFVMIDGPQLFQLYDIFEVTTLPTILFMQNGEQVARLADDIDRAAIERNIANKFINS